MNVVICDAIRTRRLLRFVYDGYERIVEPHLYGVNSAGHEMLTAWLRPGHSRTDPQGGWRNYRLDDLSRLQMLPETFDSPRPGFNPNDSRMREVYCALTKRDEGMTG